MARVQPKKWRPGEARKVLASRDPSTAKQRQEIAKRYPFFSTATADELVSALDLLGNVSARRLEKALRIANGLSNPSDASSGDEDDDDYDEEDDPGMPDGPPSCMVKKQIPNARPNGVKSPSRIIAAGAANDVIRSALHAGATPRSAAYANSSKVVSNSIASVRRV